MRAVRAVSLLTGKEIAVKKLTALLIAGAMCLPFAACKKDIPMPIANTDSITAPPENNEDYVMDDALLEYFGWFMETKVEYESMYDDFDFIIESIEELDEGEEFSEDELKKWADSFFTVKNTMERVVDAFNNKTDFYPDAQADHDEFKKWHVEVLKPYTNFEDAVLAALAGDTNNFYAGLKNFYEAARDDD